MRAAQVACWLAVVGLAILPTGCANEAAGSADSGGATTTVTHSEHSGRPSTTEAPTTTAAAPTRLDIVATDYEWSGLPDELPAGTYPMSFMNNGAEAHEIAIFRNPSRLALEEIHQLGPVGMKESVEMVGMLISGAGTPAAEEITITLTPGEYEVVCFIPAASDMQPHFAHGMHRKLVVR